MNKDKQKGFLGEGIGEGIGTLFVVAVIISAIVGWGIIEGILWLFSHISITLI